MPKRPNPRAIKAARTYTVDEAATALGVSIGTVRGWVRNGMPIMKSQRPYLILGDALRNFLNNRRENAKTPLKPDQLYCLTCKGGRTPLGMMADLIPQTTKTARLSGLCELCGGTCNRMIGTAQLPRFAAIFDVAYPDHRKA